MVAIIELSTFYLLYLPFFIQLYSAYKGFSKLHVFELLHNSFVLKFSCWLLKSQLCRLYKYEKQYLTNIQFLQFTDVWSFVKTFNDIIPLITIKIISFSLTSDTEISFYLNVKKLAEFISKWDCFITKMRCSAILLTSLIPQITIISFR